jgi:parallel beta-helix repeat protein
MRAICVLVALLVAASASAQTRGPQPTITCPAGAVSVFPGASIQSAVSAHPAGTSFCLRAGVHRVASSIVPKTGNTFTGEYGAILEGAGWTTTDLDAAVFRGVDNGVTGVTIRNLVLRNGPSYGVNAWLSASRWTVDQNEIHGFRNGVSVGTTGVISNNWIHHNAGIFNDPRPELRGGGIILNCASGTRITSNDVSYNGQEQKIIVGCFASAGTSRNYYLAGNFYHHNVGDGIWFDGDGNGSIVEHNTVEDNGGPGITLEATDNVTVRNNAVRRNRYEGIYLTVAKNSTVTGNTLDGNAFGIGLYLDFASLPPESPVLPWGLQDLANNTVAGNHVRVPVGGYGGMLTMRGSGDYSPYATNEKANRFIGNTYELPTPTGNWFMWANINKTFAQWQALGHDVTATSGPAPPANVRVQ